MKVAIIGATGYGGAELIRIIHQHKYIQQYSLYSSSQSGMKISESYPQFNGVDEQKLQEINVSEIVAKHDIIFMATPSGISRKLTPEIIDAGGKVIDLSGDFRFKDPHIYEKWYGHEAAPVAVLEQAVYGLTELNREQVKTASLIANPGCYPTATILGLYPLLKNVEVAKDTIIIDAKSGASGAGRKASQSINYCEVNENFRIYKVNQHQHIPEIEQTLQVANEHIGSIKFNTHLVPMTRGIMATIYVKPDQNVTEAELNELYHTTYESEKFVRVRQVGHFPATKEVYGSNYCDIAITLDERTGWITIVSVIDNLMKGAAGQAIQNLNVMYGFEEDCGLHSLPVFP